MDKIDIRSCLLVAAAGLLCLLNTSVVSAQTATNLKCAWCVGPGELRWNTVGWFTLDPTLRQGLIAQQDKINAMQGTAVRADQDSYTGNTAAGWGALPVNTYIYNTAFGHGALNNNTTGGSNSAFGYSAMFSNVSGHTNAAFGHNNLSEMTDGIGNTALGPRAMTNLLHGNDNTGVGKGALNNLVLGSFSTAVGSQALANGGGDSNVAIGFAAMNFVADGAENIAIGAEAGTGWQTSEGQNIAIGNTGVVGESQTSRLGDVQTRAFIAGIRGVTTGAADATAVVIDSNGQLATVSSSIRYKEDVQDLGISTDALLSLRPVSFRYQQPYEDGSKPIQCGLIAEEVAEVLSELVVYDQSGEPETVKYRVLSTPLLKQAQLQQEELRVLRSELADLRLLIDEIHAAQQAAPSIMASGN